MERTEALVPQGWGEQTTKMLITNHVFYLRKKEEPRQVLDLKPTTKSSIIASKTRQSSKTIPPCYYLCIPLRACRITLTVRLKHCPSPRSHSWAKERAKAPSPRKHSRKAGPNFTLEFRVGSATVRCSPRQKTEVL